MQGPPTPYPVPPVAAEATRKRPRAIDAAIEAAYRRAIALDPQIADSHAGLARLLSERGVTSREPLDLMMTAIQIAPGRNDYRVNFGIMLANREPFADARTVLAPVAGRIAHVRSDRPDMPLGKSDQEIPTGNSVSIQTEDGRYLVLAHLKQSTLLVREGDPVTIGQELARCGNSGDARVPHLFLQAQDRPVALSGHVPPRTFQLRFVDAWRVRDDDITAEPFVVRRNDIIGPVREENEDLDTGE